MWILKAGLAESRNYWQLLKRSGFVGVLMLIMFIGITLGNPQIVTETAHREPIVFKLLDFLLVIGGIALAMWKKSLGDQVSQVDLQHKTAVSAINEKINGISIENYKKVWDEIATLSGQNMKLRKELESLSESNYNMMAKIQAREKRAQKEETKEAPPVVTPEVLAQMYPPQQMYTPPVKPKRPFGSLA